MYTITHLSQFCLGGSSNSWSYYTQNPKYWGDLFNRRGVWRAVCEVVTTQNGGALRSAGPSVGSQAILFDGELHSTAALPHGQRETRLTWSA